jgi:hypothetical protein
VDPAEEDVALPPPMGQILGLSDARWAVNRLVEKLHRGLLPPLIRDIWGNPFRRVAIDPSLLTWHEGCVMKMAHAIYDERAFDRLPILADAMEDAGRSDADLLAHLRIPGQHVRGCWVVDLLLGKS